MILTCLLASFEDHAGQLVLVAVQLGHQGRPDGTHGLLLVLQVVDFGANHLGLIKQLKGLLQCDLVTLSKSLLLVNYCFKVKLRVV